MQIKSLDYAQEFSIEMENQHAQAGVMVIAPGNSEGGPENSHGGADQWLYVVAGRGEAIVAEKWHPLEKGTMLLIERGETHEIRNTGEGPLETLNFYVPPAFKPNGDPLPAGEP